MLEARDMKQIIKGDKWNEIMSEIRQKSGICSNCFDANNWSENGIYYGKGKIKGLAYFVRRHWLNR